MTKETTAAYNTLFEGEKRPIKTAIMPR